MELKIRIIENGLLVTDEDGIDKFYDDIQDLVHFVRERFDEIHKQTNNYGQEWELIFKLKEK